MKTVSDSTYKKTIVSGNYFLDLSIQDVRCFGKKQKIILNRNGKPFQWTIILGDNGVGKTSLLKSFVALAPSPKIMYSSSQKFKLYPGYLDWNGEWDMRRHEGMKPSVLNATTVAGTGISKISKNSELSLSLSNHHKSIRDLSYPEEAYTNLGDFLCFAYGASRKMGRSTLSGERYSTASVTLFDDEATLINVEEFFLQADYEAKSSKSKLSFKQRDKVKRLLLDILPEVSDLRITKERRATGRVVQLKTKFGWVRISEMSLGYKSLIAWVVDFASRMYHYHRTKPEPFKEPAVVLIDEIDLHLHPRWQRKILTYLSRKFPNTQFIATAHSPLIVQAALKANLVLLKRSGGQVIIENSPEVIANWRIDQILTSDLFGLSSARSSDVEKIFKARRELLLKSNLSKAEKSKLKKLEEKVESIPVAETPEYIKAMQKITEASAKL